MPVALGYDVAYDVLLHLALHIVIVNHSECQRQQVGSHRVAHVAGTVGIEHVSRHFACSAVDGEEFIVECLLHFFCLGCKMACVIIKVLHPCKTLHELVHPVIVCRGNEGAVSHAALVLGVYQLQVLGRQTPVTVLVARHKSVLSVLRAQMVKP